MYETATACNRNASSAGRAIPSGPNLMGVAETAESIASHTSVVLNRLKTLRSRLCGPFPESAQDKTGPSGPGYLNAICQHGFEVRHYLSEISDQLDALEAAIP